MAEIPTLTDAEIERMLDQESGTMFDWLDMPPFVDLSKKEVVEYPDRTWTSEALEMIQTDGQAAGVEAALTMPLTQANLSIEQPERDKSGRITGKVEELLFKPQVEGGMRTPFPVVFAQMTLAATVRRTYHELVWKKDSDGRYVYDKIAWRPPQSCEMVRDRDHGDPKGFKQFIDWDSSYRQRAGTDWTGYIQIPPQRSVIHINRQHRDPIYGWSDLGATYWAWSMKRKVLDLWYCLLGRAAQPWTLAYGDSQPEATNNARQISRLRSGGVAGVVRPSNPEHKLFETIDTGAASAVMLFQGMIGYLDGMMTQSVMAGWMDLAGANNNPARASTALSADQSGLFMQSRRYAATELQATVNHQIILPFVRVNYGPKAPVPLLKVEKIAADQVEKAMAMLQQLGSAQSQNVPDGFIDLLIERVAQYLDLPDDKVRKLLADRAKEARAKAELAGAPVAAEGTPEGNLEDAVNGALGATAGVAPGGGPAPAGPPEEAAA